MQTLPTISVFSLGVFGLVACANAPSGPPSSGPPDPPAGETDLEIRHSGAAVTGSSFQCTGDRRADWRTTGACPFGICLRGDLGDHAGFWPYHPPYAPGTTMWIHHGDEAQPAVFGFDAAPDQLERFRPRSRFAATPEVINPGAFREVRLQLPVTPQAVLGRLTPPVVLRPGPPRLQIRLGGDPLELGPELALR